MLKIPLFQWYFFCMIFKMLQKTDFISHTESTDIHRKDYTNEAALFFLQMTSFNLSEDFIEASFQLIFCQIKTFIIGIKQSYTGLSSAKKHFLYFIYLCGTKKSVLSVFSV